MRQAPVSKGCSSIWLRWSAFLLVAVWASAAPSPSYAQFGSRDRILEPVQGARFSMMPGNLRPSARAADDQGELSGATRLGRVTMFFNRTPEQAADLEALLEQQQDRGSANYHRWLSPEEFADRFGVSQGDVDKVVAWLQSQGLTIEQVSRSRSWVAFSGTAQQINAALRTDLRRYAVGGETHFMMSREPALPSALAGVVLGFRGLDDFRLKARVKKLQSHFTSEISGNHFLTPGDLATIYNLTPLYNAGTNGTGQTIAIAGQSNINVADIQAFRSSSGLAPNVPQVLLVPKATSGDDDPGMVAGDIDESNLDVEWAGAVARNASIVYVYSKNVLDAFAYIVDQKLAPVLSISYGLCEGGTDGFTQSDANILSSIAQQGNAKGITIVAPTGDAGAADCDNDVAVAKQGLSIDLPGGLPYVTSVGGTRFSGDVANPTSFWGPATTNPSTALGYIPETSWNDNSSSGLAATGGGSSRYFPKPSWQTGTGVPNDGARDVPDVSFNASGNHDGYLVCSRDVPTDSPTCVVGFRKANTDLTVFGGTSAGVPIFAGIVALLNQQTASPQGQGNVNYVLYPLATSFPAAFHDITSGNNLVPCDLGPPSSPDCPTSGANQGFIGFSAGFGYDRVTGLGSLDVSNVVTAWTSVSSTGASKNSGAADFQLVLSPPKLALSRGGSGVAQLTLTNINGFAAAVSVSCTASGSLTCSVSGAGNSRTITVSATGFGAGYPVIWNRPQVFLLGFWFVVASLGLIAVTARRRLRWVPVAALSCLLVAAIGCKSGGDNNSNAVTPAAGSVAVLGTSGSVSHTATLSITVN